MIKKYKIFIEKEEALIDNKMYSVLFFECKVEDSNEISAGRIPLNNLTPNYICKTIQEILNLKERTELSKK